MCPAIVAIRLNGESGCAELREVVFADPKGSRAYLISLQVVSCL